MIKNIMIASFLIFNVGCLGFNSKEYLELMRCPKDGSDCQTESLLVEKSQCLQERDNLNKQVSNSYFVCL